MKILIIEDDKILSRTVEQCLKGRYEIDAAYDGGEGLLYAKQEIYDLIILDIMMPVMDGYQALVGIRNMEKERNIPDEKAVKVIMATALNDEKNVKMAFELGCTIYSGKPIDQERFEEALKRLDLI